MKYSVNLYIDDLKPTVYYMTLKNAVYAALISLIVMAGITFYLQHKQQEQDKRLKVLQSKVNSAQENLKQLQAALVKHNDKATFNNQKELLEKNLQAKKMLWEGVGKQIQTTTVDYFLVMDELTKHHDHNLWLSGFKFNESHALFKGYALDSSAVTNWMTYLQVASSFEGREFSYMNVKAVSNQLVSFQVATDESLVTDVKEFKANE